MHTFEIKEQFYLDGKPFRIISGSIHYFRVLPEYWKDRLEKLKALGCNTVETYIPWNLHEPKCGSYDFYGEQYHGMLDIARFVKEAQELGLWVILRPTPYICAEWEFGGFPAWLLKEDGLRLRTSDERYLFYVRRYFKELMEVLVPLQIQYGGPVIMMQVENEYGSFGNDKDYLLAIRDMMIEEGIKVPLFSSDGAEHSLFRNTSIPNVLPTANFGSRAEVSFDILKQYNQGGPCMCMEFWIGWFDYWNDKNEKHYGDTQVAVENLDYILANGSVNIYMFEGGTNFGFFNGANYFDNLMVDVTSYDYDALLTEDGQITEKYKRFRDVIFKYLPEEVKATLKKPEDFGGRDAAQYGEVELVEKVGLMESLHYLSEAVETKTPLSMERLDQNYGYILYSTVLDTESDLARIQLYGAADRAIVYVDGKKIFTAADKELQKEHCFETIQSMNKRLDILVENQGRVNYGVMLNFQRKGIDSCVRLNKIYAQHDWMTYCLPLDNIDKLSFDAGFTEGQPAFYKFKFNVNEVKDTFLDFTGWGKGVAFVNDFNVGRFWEVGPQKRLYIPGALLEKGENEIILFETEGKYRNSIFLANEPRLY